MRRIREVFFFILILLMTLLMRVGSGVQAEIVGSTINAPITFTASEAVTAADFTISVSGGTFSSVACGGAGFNDLSSSGSRCIIFNVDGATSGTIATVMVLADTVGTLVVSATGTLSTAGGSEPSSWSLTGATYNIIAGSTSTPTPTGTLTPTPTGTLTPTPTSATVSTPTPITTSTLTPTPTSTPVLPKSGVVSETLSFFLFTCIFFMFGLVGLKHS